MGIEYFTDPLGLKRKKLVPLPVTKKEAPTRNSDVTARAVLASGKGQLPAPSIADAAGGKQVTDKTSLAKADQAVERKGFERALDQWRDAQAYKSKVAKDGIALAQKLHTEVIAAGDTRLVMQLTAELCLEAARAGQEVQAFHPLKKMAPDGQLHYLQGVVNQVQGGLGQRMGSRSPTLEINKVCKRPPTDPKLAFLTISATPAHRL